MNSTQYWWSMFTLNYFTSFLLNSLARAITSEPCGVVGKGSLHTHVELGLGSTIRLRLARRFGHPNYARLDTRVLPGDVTSGAHMP